MNKVEITESNVSLALKLQHLMEQSLQVTLPKWGSLDASSAWQDFAAFFANPSTVKRVGDFAPEAVLGIDWTSLTPYKHLQDAFISLEAPCPPYIFLNYR